VYTLSKDCVYPCTHTHGDPYISVGHQSKVCHKPCSGEYTQVRVWSGSIPVYVYAVPKQTT